MAIDSGSHEKSMTKISVCIGTTVKLTVRRVLDTLDK